MKTTLVLSFGWLLALGACGASSDDNPGAAPDPSSGGGGSRGGSAGTSGSVAGTGSSGSSSSAGSGGSGVAGNTSGSGGAAGTGGTADTTAGGNGGMGASGSDGGAADAGRSGAGGVSTPDGGGSPRADAGVGTDAAPRPDGAGTPGLGPWTTGYVATMYGNNMSGDCAGYPNFSDMTAIRTSTCSRVVAVSTFAQGVANNASFYGATGDVSTLWTGATCTCNGNDTCTGTQSPSCPAEQQAGGNCGICVAVRCDAAGTFALSGSTHNQDCNATSFAVVQILDACPHNHPTNVASIAGWCTSRQANHIDLSCSALGGISTLGMNIGRDGWLNVAVQRVDCSIGLGLHPL